MKRLFVCLLMVALVGIAGCVDMNETALQSENETVQITSGGETYPAYVAAPSEEGRRPAIVLIHSINGLEPGYKVMADKLASDGFVVVAPEWQTFNRTPLDEVVMQLVSDSIAYLKTRDDVDAENIGLTGFCIGGRYTMLFLPQITELKSGVAWYGFPYSGGSYNQSMPAEFVQELNVPMLIIHGTRDQYSNISDIFRYATVLDGADKYFELKVYQGEPHGFMIDDEGQLSQSFPAKDAYWQMATFFNRTLV
jgi:carboxymethylenebutenolidase